MDKHLLVWAWAQVIVKKNERYKKKHLLICWREISVRSWAVTLSFWFVRSLLCLCVLLLHCALVCVSTPLLTPHLIVIICVRLEGLQYVEIPHEGIMIYNVKRFYVCLGYFYSHFTQTIYWFYSLSCYLISCVLGSYHLRHMYKIFTTHTFTQRNINLEKGDCSKNWGYLSRFHKSRVCQSISFQRAFLPSLDLCVSSKKHIFYMVYHTALISIPCCMISISICHNMVPTSLVAWLL